MKIIFVLALLLAFAAISVHADELDEIDEVVTSMCEEECAVETEDGLMVDDDCVEECVETVYVLGALALEDEEGLDDGEDQEVNEDDEAYDEGFEDGATEAVTALTA